MAYVKRVLVAQQIVEAICEVSFSGGSLLPLVETLIHRGRLLVKTSADSSHKLLISLDTQDA
jgi:hypothetical protein